MKNRSIRILAVLFVALLLTLGTSCALADPEEWLGSILPDFTVTTFSGETFTLSESLKTHPLVLINCWATWCEPCRMEFPHLETAWEQYEDRVDVVALSIEETDTPDVLREFANNYGLRFPIARDESNLYGTIGGHSIPTTLIVNRDMRVVAVEIGSKTSVEAFTSLFDRLLNPSISMSGRALPGSTVQMSVDGNTEGKTFTWSVEGTGATINEQTGTLTFDPNATPGMAFTVTASTAEGDETSTLVFLKDGILNCITFAQASDEGFAVGHPVGNGWSCDEFYNQYYGYLINDDLRTGQGQFYVDGKLFTMDSLIEAGYAENPEKAKALLAEIGMDPDNARIKEYEGETIDIDGHPAQAEKYAYYNEDGSFYGYIGMLYYPRNDRLLRIRVYSIPLAGGNEESAPKVTLNDLRLLASKIVYNEENAPLSAKNAAITISAKGDPAGIMAGKAVQFTAEFADKDQINKKAKNDGVTWSVVNAETGEAVAEATITEKGQLKIDKGLSAPVTLEVKARSPIYETEAVYRLEAMPVIKSVTVEPAELFFYTGTDIPQTVKATLDPAIEPKGLTWTPNKAGIVEITEEQTGTVSVRPLAAGKISIEVKEPGGKKAKLAVNIVEPVTALTLTAKGNDKPGGSVTITQVMEPKKPGNATVEWSLDVGEDVATISPKGQVKIAKGAAAGTKITVTCKAQGAPEPVVATIELEVAGK